MANTRYTRMVNQIKADLRQERGRTIDTTRLDNMLTAASNWFLSINPDGWPFTLMSVETTAETLQTHTISVRDGDGTLGELFDIMPRVSGAWDVRTRVDTNLPWRPLKYRSWRQMSNMPSFTRVASTTNNQIYWSLRIQGTKATKYSTVTLETFPYSYATGTLHVQIDCARETPRIAAGDDADDALIWDNDNWDWIVTYFAEALLAHELNDILPGAFDRAWGLARELAFRALVDWGVSERRIKLPPPWLTRRTIAEGAEV